MRAGRVGAQVDRAFDFRPPFHWPPVRGAADSLQSIKRGNWIGRCVESAGRSATPCPPGLLPAPMYICPVLQLTNAHFITPIVGTVAIELVDLSISVRRRRRRVERKVNSNNLASVPLTRQV